MDEVNETLIAMAAENYADSLERRGCSFWQGLYRGYIAGYRACDGKEPFNDTPDGGLSKHDVMQRSELLLAFVNWYNEQKDSKYIPNSVIGKFNLASNSA